MPLVLALLAVAAVLVAMVIYYRADRNFYKSRARESEAILVRTVEYAQRQQDLEIKQNEREKTQLSDAAIDQRDAFSDSWMLDRASDTHEAAAPSASESANNIAE